MRTGGNGPRCTRYLALLAALVVAAAIPGSLGARSLLLETPASTVPVQGLLQALHTDASATWTSTSIWLVAYNDNTYVLPGQPSESTQGTLIPPGSQIKLTCVLGAPPAGGMPSASWTPCARIFNVARVPSSRERMLSSGMSRGNVSLDQLTILISVNSSCPLCPGCRHSPAVNAADVDRLIFSPGGHADYWHAASFGRLTINRNTSRTVSVTVPCTSATMLTSCDWASMTRSADALARAAVGEHAWALLYGRLWSHDNHGRRSYIMPAGMTQVCKWSGQAYVPSTQLWLQSDPRNGINSKSTPLHELIHSFGLHHARKDGFEYGDSTSVMGNASVCPAAPEMRRLGWASARADLDQGSLPARSAFIRFTLPALASTPSQSFIRIRPNWQTQNNQNLYLSYRVRTGCDADLVDAWNNKIVVHRVGNTAFDNEDPPTSSGDDQTELYGQAAFGGAALDLKLYKLAVRAVSASNTTATLEVCRYATSASECSSGDASNSTAPAVDDGADPRSTYGPAPSPPPPPPALPSGPSPIKTPPLPVSYRYVSCMADNSSRALPDLLDARTGMTVDRCARLAHGQGMPLFGLKYGTQCWGGYSLQRARAVGASGECTTPCTGDNSTVCGGSVSISLYMFTPCAGSYLGCFGESLTGAGGVALPHELDLGADGAMTHERCEAAARLYGYEFFGLAGGSRCWLGASLPQAMRFGVRNTCSQPCSGNANQVCGASDLGAFSLYRTNRCETELTACRASSCAAAFPDFPECVSAPEKDADGAWGGWCVARSVGFPAASRGFWSGSNYTPRMSGDARRLAAVVVDQ